MEDFLDRKNTVFENKEKFIQNISQSFQGEPEGLNGDYHLNTIFFHIIKLIYDIFSFDFYDIESKRRKDEKKNENVEQEENAGKKENTKIEENERRGENLKQKESTELKENEEKNENIEQEENSENKEYDKNVLDIIMETNEKLVSMILEKEEKVFMNYIEEKGK